MSPGSSEGREPPQVRLEDIHPAEDAGLLVGDPGGVELPGVLWGEEVPTLPSDRSRCVRTHSRIRISKEVQEL